MVLKGAFVCFRLPQSPVGRPIHPAARILEHARNINASSRIDVSSLPPGQSASLIVWMITWFVCGLRTVKYTPMAHIDSEQAPPTSRIHQYTSLPIHHTAHRVYIAQERILANALCAHSS